MISSIRVHPLKWGLMTIVVSIILVAIIVLCVSNLKNVKESKAGISQEDMIYFIFTDRFNNGDKTNDFEVDKNDPYAYHGGDWQGIIDKLDYIKSLGFTTIWISPVVKNDAGSYHGYLTTDFYKTNPNFGTMEKLKELVKKAHSKEIKVVLDFVVNHTGRTHPWADDSKYYNWFNHIGPITNWDDQAEVEQGNLDNLPDLNQDNPEVEKYLLDMTKWWILQTDVDGFRLDTFKHVPVSFWNSFCKTIKSVKPNFYMVGEVFNGMVYQLADYQTSTGVGMLDFPAYNAVKDVFGQPEGTATILADVITQSNETYDNPYIMGTFIDNHDVPRFIYPLQDSADKTKKLEQALTFMMTYTGIPIMYNGTEIEMNGGPDPDNRHDMDWKTESSVTDYVKKLTVIRSSNKALTHGTITVLASSDHYLCYSRDYENEKVIVAFNTSGELVSFPLNIEKNENGSLESLLDESTVALKDGSAELNMAPYQADVYIIKR